MTSKPHLRCIADIFGYCSGTPKLIKDIITVPSLDLGGRAHSFKQVRLRCTKDPKACPYFLTQTMLINRQLNIAQPVISPS